MTAKAQDPKTARRVSAVLRILALVAVLMGLHMLARSGLGQFDMSALPGPTIPVAMGVYALLLSLPCVPAAEIGLAMLAMYGAPLALPVWGASVAGLSLAYLVGRSVPPAATVRALEALRLRRVTDLFSRMEAMGPAERAKTLREAAPSWLPDVVLRRRYVTLALLIALPGNIVLGGGGGLSMMAGLSRLYTPAGFVAASAAATAPVPLTVLLLGL